MLKYTLLIALSLGLCYSSQSQNPYQLGIGGGVGYMNYVGDIATPFLYEDARPAFNISLEGSFSPAWSMSLQYAEGSFIAEDRAINSDGNFRADWPNFERSLNVKTYLQSISLSFQYNFANGKLIREGAFINPYIGAGFAFFTYNPKADLFDDDGNRYHYWTDNTVRSAPQNTPNAPISSRNYQYETALRGLNTEAESYDEFSWSIPLSAGIKFQFSERLNLNTGVIFHFTATDYLDDISGNFPENYENDLQAYASNPNDIVSETRGTPDTGNDKFYMIYANLQYRFGRRKQQTFKAPRAYNYQPQTYAPEEDEMPAETIAVSAVDADDKVSGDDQSKAPADTVYIQEDGNQWLVNLRPGSNIVIKLDKGSTSDRPGTISEKAKEDSVRIEQDSVSVKEDSIITEENSIAEEETIKPENLQQQSTERVPGSRSNDYIKLNREIEHLNRKIDSLNNLPEAPARSSARDTLVIEQAERARSTGTAQENNEQHYDRIYQQNQNASRELQELRRSIAQLAAIQAASAASPPAGGISVPVVAQPATTARRPADTTSSIPPDTTTMEEDTIATAPLFMEEEAVQDTTTAAQDTSGNTLYTRPLWRSPATLSDKTLNTSSDFNRVGAGSTGAETSKEEEDWFNSLESTKYTIYFKLNQKQLEEEELSALQQFIAPLKGHEGYHILLEGHTDASGNAYQNFLLSGRRTNAIKDALMSYGISEDKILISNFGQEKATGNPDEDRRVSLQLLP